MEDRHLGSVSKGRNCTILGPETSYNRSKQDKKSNLGQQTNKIINFLSRSTFNPQLFVTDIINELVDTCVRPAFFFASSIINEVISKLEIENASSFHSGVNVTEKTHI